jgi:F-type H+-transporting ATPase subunit epsilon
MPGQLTLRVLTPERIVADTVVDSVRLPGLDGSIGVLPRHAPMVAALGEGLLRYRTGGVEVDLFVAGGFAEVRENTLRILTGASERLDEIDVQRAREAERRARERLAVRGDVGRREEIDFLRAEAALRRSLMRLQLSRRSGR